jgi:hypothetical protein
MYLFLDMSLELEARYSGHWNTHISIESSVFEFLQLLTLYGVRLQLMLYTNIILMISKFAIVSMIHAEFLQRLLQSHVNLNEGAAGAILANWNATGAHHHVNQSTARHVFTSLVCHKQSLRHQRTKADVTAVLTKLRTDAKQVQHYTQIFNDWNQEIKSSFPNIKS